MDSGDADLRAQLRAEREAHAAALAAARATHAADAARLETEIAAARGAARRSETRAEEAAAAKDHAEARAASAEQSVVELREQLTSANHGLEALDAERAELAAEMGSAQEARDALAVRCKSLQESVASLETAVAAATTAAAAQPSEQGSSSEAGHAAAAGGGSCTRCAASETERHAAESRAAGLSTELAEARAALAAQDGADPEALAALRAEVARCNEREASRVAMAARLTALESASADAAVAQEALDVANRRIERMVEAAAARDARVAALEGDNDELAAWRAAFADLGNDETGSASKMDCGADADENGADRSDDGAPAAPLRTAVTPSAVRAILDDVQLRLREADLARESAVGDLRAKCAGLETEIAEVRTSAGTAQALQGKQTALVEETRAKLRTAERACALAERERDAARRILASYEEMIDTDHQQRAQQQQGATDGATAGAAGASSADGAKNTVGDDDNDGDDDGNAMGGANDDSLVSTATPGKPPRSTSSLPTPAKDGPIALRARIETLEQSLAAKTAESEAMVDAHRREMDALMGECARMEARVGRGEFNTATTKVVHMRVNPESQAQDRRRAQQEQEQREKNGQQQHQQSSSSSSSASLPEGIDALKQRVRELESAAAASGGTAPASAAGAGAAAAGCPPTPAAAAEKLQTLEISVQSLQRNLSDQEKLNARMKEVFKTKITEFRRACTDLTGYKIEMLEGSKYRLTSVFATRENDHLLFVKDPKSGYQLLDTAFGRALGEDVTAYLFTFNCIPAFLASVTKDLFENRTFKPTSLPVG
jgi:hypothetical protein